MKKKFLALFLVLVMIAGLLAGCGPTNSPGDSTGDSGSGSGGNSDSSGGGGSDVKEDTLTIAGTPRSQTLCVEMLGGINANPAQHNPYMTGTIAYPGIRQLVLSDLWDKSDKEASQFPVLASEMPVALNEDYTSFEIHLTKGIKWSDGEDFNADDVVFTFEEIMRLKDSITQGVSLSNIVESIEKVDDYTIILNTTGSRTRLTENIGVLGSRGSYPILPEHYWKDHDLTTDAWEYPIGTGPYTLTSYDPNGAWYLYTLREDAEYSDVGVVTGKVPAPQYILYTGYGSVEAKMMAMANGDLDICTSFGLEESISLIEGNDNYRGFSLDYPYVGSNVYVTGLRFNCAVEPFDQIAVRRALMLTVNAVDHNIAQNQGQVYATPIVATPNMTDIYHIPMRQTLIDYTWEDGYAPFDPNYAQELCDTMKAKGYYVPDGITEDEMINKYGIGWWKNDADKAEELLLSAGLTRDSAGMWIYDGKRVSFEIQTLSNLKAGATSAADAWREFGFDCTVQVLETAAYNDNANKGNFTVNYSNIGSAYIVSDLYNRLTPWKSTAIKPIGEGASNFYRFSSEKMDDALNKLAKIPSSDPQVTDLCKEALMVIVDEVPVIPLFCDQMSAVQNLTYFTHYPTEEGDNRFNYCDPCASAYKFIISEFEKVQ